MTTNNYNKMWGAGYAAIFALGVGLSVVMPVSAAVPGTKLSQVGNSTFQFTLQKAIGIQLAQAGDAAFRINQLEDQVRRLNGQVEELNFQLLQMQEQLRRMQEDNEFRFQELEGGKSGAVETKAKTKLAKKSESSLEKLKPSESQAQKPDSGGDVASKKIAKLPKIIDGVEIFDPDNPGELRRGTETSKPLGTITFDSLGKVVSTAVGKPLDLTFKGAGKGTRPTGLPNTSQESSGNGADAIVAPGELYNLGFEYFQAGDYINSEKVFSSYLKRFPKGKKAAKANFWLGESLFAQAKFKDSAEVFLGATKKWPKSRLGAQTMLKLGLSLAGMQQRELACATYAKVFKSYPNMSNSVRKRVVVEQKSAHCGRG